jgi:hypothetical protein
MAKTLREVWINEAPEPVRVFVNGDDFVDGAIRALKKAPCFGGVEILRVAQFPVRQRRGKKYYRSFVMHCQFDVQGEKVNETACVNIEIGAR